MHLEPPESCERISVQTAKKEQQKEQRKEEIKNKEIRDEENNSQIIINSLTNENVRLRRTIKILKLR